MVSPKLVYRRELDDLMLHRGTTSEASLSTWVADTGDASVLLLDEGADLMGRRTEVRDSHDRYADLDPPS